MPWFSRYQHQSSQRVWTVLSLNWPFTINQLINPSVLNRLFSCLDGCSLGMPFDKQKADDSSGWFQTELRLFDCENT